MALMTQINRDGTALTLRWGWWHVEVMTKAIRTEMPDLPEFILDAWSDPRVSTGYTLTQAHHFEDPADGEVLDLLPGDRLLVWRDR